MGITNYNYRRTVEGLKDWWSVDVGRLVYDITHFTSNEPYDIFTKRVPRKDLQHAYTGILVNLLEVLSYPVAHILAVGLPLYLVYKLVF